jgi:hypothetical protein
VAGEKIAFSVRTTSAAARLSLKAVNPFTSMKRKAPLHS